MQSYVPLTQQCPKSMPRQKSQLAAFSAFLVGALIVLSTAPASAQKRGAEIGNLPRFVSIKADPVNLRTGPGQQYPKAWVFRRAGLPVEIIQAHGTWRRVRDAEGTSGWISRYLLSRRRTALVLPWEVKKSAAPVYVDLKSSKQRNAKTIARLEAGSLADLKSCDGQWCRVAIEQFTGYILQSTLWGVYPSEKI